MRWAAACPRAPQSSRRECAIVGGSVSPAGSAAGEGTGEWGARHGRDRRLRWPQGEGRRSGRVDSLIQVRPCGYPRCHGDMTHELAPVRLREGIRFPEPGSGSTGRHGRMSSRLVSPAGSRVPELTSSVSQSVARTVRAGRSRPARNPPVAYLDSPVSTRGSHWCDEPAHRARG